MQARHVGSDPQVAMGIPVAEVIASFNPDASLNVYTSEEGEQESVHAARHGRIRQTLDLIEED